MIAVRITDTGGLGGILGKAEEVYLEIDGQRYSLAGDWVYKPSVVTSMYKVSGIVRIASLPCCTTGWCIP